jgi:hypothetical protein
VDSGSTIMAFVDAESIIKKYNIITKKLLVPRLLYFVDSIPTLLVMDYFTTWMSIGLYTEAILFFIIKLSPATPIILNML